MREPLKVDVYVSAFGDVSLSPDMVRRYLATFDRLPWWHIRERARNKRARRDWHAVIGEAAQICWQDGGQLEAVEVEDDQPCYIWRDNLDKSHRTRGQW